jgi:hypothetical protein
MPQNGQVATELAISLALVLAFRSIEIYVLRRSKAEEDKSSFLEISAPDSTGRTRCWSTGLNPFSRGFLFTSISGFQPFTELASICALDGLTTRFTGWVHPSPGCSVLLP